MNQIVITKTKDHGLHEMFKVAVMGLGRTDEVFYLTEEQLRDNMHLLLVKLVPTSDL